jgi:hypothetical protein
MSSDEKALEEFDKFWIYFVQYYPEKEKGLFGSIKQFILKTRQEAREEERQLLDTHTVKKKIVFLGYVSRLVRIVRKVRKPKLLNSIKK